MVTYKELMAAYPKIKFLEAVAIVAKPFMPCPVCGNKEPEKCAAYVIKKMDDTDQKKDVLLDSEIIVKCQFCGTDLNFENGITPVPLNSEQIAHFLTTETEV